MNKVTRDQAKILIERELRGLMEEEPLNGWDDMTFITLARKLSYWLDADIYSESLRESYEFLWDVDRAERGVHHRILDGENALTVLDECDDMFTNSLRTLTGAWFQQPVRHLAVAA